ncbi:endonuclease/exonuclease/phosphatase family protein [Lutibacter sp. TH_r2]|uniref:endonuclease/exonuclease/phosphatase family protein n=1 Tax=Lutibacter sp. TH_r2 TaxID=3082083 RepID=UPI0029556647|nr:endonuclease/exonuclease/phosphatase family protein [Lutibacter sp. TH_r2]MDV7186374.1 endonuclease/exonuclease/phosphatase family protein [Lutibacter sp. TH_r2]
MKKLLITLLLVGFFTRTIYSQNNYKIRTVAFYNLENLYDTFDDPDKMDEESPILKIKANRDTVYTSKIENMAKVISEIGLKESKNSPVLIGVAEVENRKVLEDLVTHKKLKNKDYGIIHFDSPDRRGIDVALLYQANYFSPTHFKTFELKIWNTKGYRLYTRDQLWVSGYLDGELVHLIINHWPSRRGGEKKSRSYREKAALLNTQIIEEIKQTDPNPKIIIMGDLNDNPNNSSLKKILKTKNKKKNIQKGDIYNPYEDLFRRGNNTLVYRNNLSLFDQIMYTSALVSKNKNYSNFKVYKPSIFKPLYLTTKTGKYKGYPFRSFSNEQFLGGFSDHFPVFIHLVKEVK